MLSWRGRVEFIDAAVIPLPARECTSTPSAFYLDSPPIGAANKRRDLDRRDDELPGAAALPAGGSPPLGRPGLPGSR